VTKTEQRWEPWFLYTRIPQAQGIPSGSPLSSSWLWQHQCPVLTFLGHLPPMPWLPAAPSTCRAHGSVKLSVPQSLHSGHMIHPGQAPYETAHSSFSFFLFCMERGSSMAGPLLPCLKYRAPYQLVFFQPAWTLTTLSCAPAPSPSPSSEGPFGRCFLSHPPAGAEAGEAVQLDGSAGLGESPSLRAVQDSAAGWQQARSYTLSLCEQGRTAHACLAQLDHMGRGQQLWPATHHSRMCALPLSILLPARDPSGCFLSHPPAGAETKGEGGDE